MPFPQPMYNFNPRSREGSDSFSLNWRIFLFLFQSTLPRRERPDLSMNCTIFNIISIHAPAKGATNCLSHMHLQSYYFNPRSREGSDVRLSCRAVLPWISIHAPAKGATDHVHYFRVICVISIHAPAKGATNAPSSLASDPRNFNPRSREGSDAEKRENPLLFFRISIHAPAKGATEMLNYVDGYPVISIHAPAKGATILH